MDEHVVDRYLQRLGADRTTTLADLHERHLRTVPFENLSVHLGEPIVLDEDAFVAKVVDRHRGGFCYELNGAFAALLRALGFGVEYLSAQVRGTGGFGPPFDHMALLVHGGPEHVDPHLADVGFGRFTARPLRWVDRGEQVDPCGVFRLEDAADGSVDVLAGEVVQYRLDVRPWRLADFGPTCWYQQTSPASHFTQGLTCSRLTESGRITLADHLLIRTERGTRTEEQLTTDDEVLRAYREHFGIALDRVPNLRSFA